MKQGHWGCISQDPTSSEALQVLDRCLQCQWMLLARSQERKELVPVVARHPSQLAAKERREAVPELEHQDTAQWLQAFTGFWWHAAS